MSSEIQDQAVELEIAQPEVEVSSDKLSPEERFEKGIQDEATLQDSLESRIKFFVDAFEGLSSHIAVIAELRDKAATPEEAAKLDRQIAMFEKQKKLFACLKDGNYELPSLLVAETKFNEDDFKYPQRYAVLFNDLVKKLSDNKKAKFAHPNFLIASLAFAFPNEPEFQRKVLHRIFAGLLKCKDTLLVANILSFPYYFQRSIAKQQMLEQLPEDEQKVVGYEAMNTAFTTGILNAFSQYR